MQGLGEPALIVASGASPHEYSLRPSEAGALQDAELVFWIGPDLTPWMEDAIETLATEAAVTSLMDVDGTTELPFREGALFEAHVHDDHDDHDDHGQYDPHAWLSLDNGAVWLNAIAAQLSAADPDNAGTYYTNAATAREEFDTLRTEINDILTPVRGRNFIVFHDAYQYFETSFDLPASGAISISDATDPSPARIAEIQARVKQQDVTCVLSEPQFDPKIVAAVMDGSDAKTGVLDPLGSDLEPSSELYGNVLRNLALALADCL
jgi:zinc transport system substrate-binding protein